MRKPVSALLGEDEGIVVEALNLSSERLSRLPHVVGLGVRESEAGSGRFVLAVYVDEMPNGTAQSPDQQIPGFIAVKTGRTGARYVNVPTRVEVIGKLRLEA